MSVVFVTGWMWGALKTAILLSAPVLGFGLVAGVLVSMLQAATQINEMTLVFIPKILAVGLAFLIFFPWMLQLIMAFTQNLFLNIPNLVH